MKNQNNGNNIITLKPLPELWLVKCLDPHKDEVIKYITSYGGIIKNTWVSKHGIVSLTVEMYRNIAYDLEMWKLILDVKKHNKIN